MKLVVRLLAEKDHEPYKRLFQEAYGECLEFLKKSKSKQFERERQESARYKLKSPIFTQKEFPALILTLLSFSLNMNTMHTPPTR